MDAPSHTEEWHDECQSCASPEKEAIMNALQNAARATLAANAKIRRLSHIPFDADPDLDRKTDIAIQQWAYGRQKMLSLPVQSRADLLAKARAIADSPYDYESEANIRQFAQDVIALVQPKRR
ncbi:hypothetical protein [Gluconobacter oxydans]|uniref:hypothetical protein n=1 Tax=Gluconobacter oxydans TaxID=442 RepID=UPI00147771D5|nr:hypothetical protein [Gluconobacter oxydans]